MNRASLIRRFKKMMLTALVVIGGACLAQAQNFPQKTLRIIVPFTPGGAVDAVARVLGQHLSENLGQPVIIENVAGAGGMLGTARAAQSAPDGYTILVGTPSTHGTNVAVYSKLPYDAIKDFVPIALISTSPLVLIASPKVDITSVGELIRRAKEKPGELAYGSFGNGSINHLAAELLLSMSDIKTNHIPYRGSAPAMTDLIAGRIHYTIEGAAALSFIRANTVKFLAVTSSKRWNFFPDIPTVSEAGAPGYKSLTWFGLFAPTGTPKPIVDLLNSKLNEALAREAVKDSFQTLGINPAGGPPHVLAKIVDDEIRKWVNVATEKNIRIDP